MPENCENCPVSIRVSGMKEEFDRYREDSKRVHEGFEKRLSDLETATAVQDEKLDTMNGKLDDIKESQRSMLSMVEEFRAKPGKRWEALVDKAIWAVAAAVIAFLLARVGL